MAFLVYFYGGATEEDDSTASRLRTLVKGEAAGRAIGVVAEQPPGRCAHRELSERFGPELVSGLIQAGAIRQEGGALWLNCPVFLEEDLEPLRRLTGTAAEDIAQALWPRAGEMEQLLAGLANGFPGKVNLYHLLCGCVFDGLYFDELEAAGLVSTGRDGAQGLSDLLILYECGGALERWSRSLLCSYNRYGSRAGTFQSFGDSAGDRWDLYRAARQLEEGVLRDASLLPLPKEALVEEYIRLAGGGPVDREAMACFARFGYAEAGRPCVPIYVWEEDRPVLDALFRLVREVTAPLIRDVLDRLGGMDCLTANRHRVPLRETANEIYHLLFGQVNERLVASGVVAPPEDHGAQGRYRKAFEIHQGTVPRPCETSRRADRGG